MPLQRNQPSPDRQSVLSFVSPSVADLLFYETVDAKTVGAGSGKTITASSWASTNINVAEGIHGSLNIPPPTAGYTVTVHTVGSPHGFETGDVVTIEGLGDREDDVVKWDLGGSPNGTYKVTVENTTKFLYFVREQPDSSSPLDVTNNPRVYKAHPNYGTAHPDTENFPKHKLCYVKQADGEGLYYEYYYAAERHHQDEYNFEFSQADLGGNKYDTVVRTYVNLRSDFQDTDAEYQAGDAMPDIPAAQFADTYILLTRQQKRIGDQELDGIFVVEQRVYFNRVDIITQNLDPATEGVLETTVSLHYRGESYPRTGSTIEVAAGTSYYWGLVDATGVNYEIEQLSHDWWKVTLQDVIPQNAAAHTTYGSGGKKIREYDTWQNFTWPAVVGSLHFTTVNKKDGSSQTALTVRNKDGKDGFSGPTKMTVLQVWSKAAFDSIPAPTIFKTVSATYSGVQFNARVSNVLTEAITLTDFIGTKDPVYKLGEYAFPKPWCHASTPTDWSNLAPSFVGSATQKPFRGGYLLEVVTVYTPS